MLWHAFFEFWNINQNIKMNPLLSLEYYLWHSSWGWQAWSPTPSIAIIAWERGCSVRWHCPFTFGRGCKNSLGICQRAHQSWGSRARLCENREAVWSLEFWPSDHHNPEAFTCEPRRHLQRDSIVRSESSRQCHLQWCLGCNLSPKQNCQVRTTISEVFAELLGWATMFLFRLHFCQFHD